jgi:hypothetical protein
MGTTSYRPKQVETRVQTWRADDRRLHVDAFAGRPNHGERILRVFANINPNEVPRMWRIGETFEDMARRFLPHIEPYRPLHAHWQRLLRKTKTLRTEYDHIMLQFHDRMKLDADYQQHAPQISMPFAAGSVWVCFSDHTLHDGADTEPAAGGAVRSGAESAGDTAKADRPSSGLSRLTGDSPS